MKITFDEADQQKEIIITKEGIHKVFGYPNGTQKTAPSPQISTDTMSDLVTELGLKKMDFHHDDLFKELEKVVKVYDEQSNRKSVKIFFLIFSTTLSVEQPPLPSANKTLWSRTWTIQKWQRWIFAR